MAFIKKENMYICVKGSALLSSDISKSAVKFPTQLDHTSSLINFTSHKHVRHIAQK